MSRTSATVMCRASSRGCTVTPWAPARTHSSTAARTEGTRPPREFRIVAILLTLTESLITLPGPYVLCHRIDDLLPPSPDVALVAAFEHHAQQGLGTRISNEQPTVTFQPGFHRRHHRHHLGNGL